MQHNSILANKDGVWLTQRWERKFIVWAIPKLPLWLRSWHLTLLTAPISLGVILFSLAARLNIHWLWMVSFLIALQWLTDSLDGSLGKARGEGLVRWGYYMDHLLDYLFLGSMLIGNALVLPQKFAYWQLLILVVYGAFMVNSFLAMAALGKFRISHLGIGATEVRIVFILTNVMLILFERTFLASFLPIVLLLSFVGLCVVVYKTQREIYLEDMRAKRG